MDSSVGGFTFKPGGRIKLDIIRDFSAITSEDSFDTRTIAVDGSDGSNSNLHAKETRLSLDIRGPVEGKELKMYVETDFYGSSSVLRLRQAYGSYGGLLAGQAWSTFVDESNFPNHDRLRVTDRLPSDSGRRKLRWTSKLGAKGSWSVAVEDNKSSDHDTVGNSGQGGISDAGPGHAFPVQGLELARAGLGFSRRGALPPRGGQPDDVTLWGGLLSAKTKTFGRDNAYGQFTFGDGVGRYRGGVTAVPDANNQLHAVGLNAFMGGYEHFWSSRYSSNADLQRGDGAGRSRSTPTRSTSASTTEPSNLLYWFLPDRAWVGVEYLYGRREVMGGDTGTAHRLQFAIRFNLPS